METKLRPRCHLWSNLRAREGRGGITWELDMLTRGHLSWFTGTFNFSILPNLRDYFNIFPNGFVGDVIAKAPNIAPRRMCLRVADEKDVSLPLGLRVFVVACEEREGRGTTKGDRLWYIFYTSDIPHQPWVSQVSAAPHSNWIFLTLWCSAKECSHWRPNKCIACI